jgi:hypothetical protein
MMMIPGAPDGSADATLPNDHLSLPYVGISRKEKGGYQLVGIEADLVPGYNPSFSFALQ